MYRIDLRSNFERLENYDFVITCAGYNKLGEEIYVDGGKSMSVECDDAESIHLIVYVVTTQIPKDRVIANSPPFPLSVIVRRDDKVIYDQQHEVNQWGGASITIKL
ncbi:MAG: hypothetical protein R3Y68_05690 [Rikenellaceae bacterium]